MNNYTIYCTPEQTKKILSIDDSLIEQRVCDSACFDALEHPEKYYESDYGIVYVIPTAEQMIGFILDSDRGYDIDLAELIKEYGYKQGCLTFIDICLK